MANRPIFIPAPEGPGYVVTRDLEMTWYAGFAEVQKAKSIRSLHEAAAKAGFARVLEISSKSADPVGVQLSAFNLMMKTETGRISVECAFQGSKVFSRGGPFTDLYHKTSREAKQDERLLASGDLEAFSYFGETWPLQPLTAFYDWLYINALDQNPQLANHLLSFDAFSDIAFNPQRSFNCQAKSAALYVALRNSGKLAQALLGQGQFLSVLRGNGQIGKGAKALPPLKRVGKTKGRNEDQPSLFKMDEGMGMDDQP